MNNELSPRFQWALEILETNASGKVLEIGFGSGELALALAQKKTSGLITAIDRSEKMVQKAKTKLDGVKPSLLEFVAIDIADLQAEKSYSMIYAFNVRLWNAIASMKEILNALKSGGSFHLFYLPPDMSAVTLKTTAQKAFLAAGFKLVGSSFRTFEGIKAFHLHLTK